MTAQAASAHVITEQAYLAGEQDSEVRHEYIDGQVYALTGSDARHGLIRNAIAFALTPVARGKHCKLFTATMKLRLDSGGQTVFYYPDLMAVCDALDNDPNFCRAPCRIVEVLSPSTARIDRREKLLAYQGLPSLQSYLLVEQEQRHVELYRRANGWRVEHYGQGNIPIDCLDAALALDDIYADLPAA